MEANSDRGCVGHCFEGLYSTRHSVFAGAPVPQPEPELTQWPYVDVCFDGEGKMNHDSFDLCIRTCSMYQKFKCMGWTFLPATTRCCLAFSDEKL